MIARIVSIIIGYCFGMIQTSYFIGKIKGIDIREHGSGNAGTTNTMRVLGKKAGILCFLVDFFKGSAATLIVRMIMMNYYPDSVNLFVVYAMLGTVLGHNFPFYLKFKGGKGIAVTGGSAVGFCDWLLDITCICAFFGMTFITRYVSVGSIFFMVFLAAEYIIFALNGRFMFNDSKAMMIESIVVIIIVTGMGIIRHHGNINRLIHHEERRIGGKKEKN